MSLFGGSKSSSTTNNTTDIRDMRVVGGELSNNVSFNAGDGSTTSVTLTDHGAVAGSLALGTQAVDAVVKNGQMLQDTTATLYGGALAFAKDANTRALQAVGDSAAQVSSMAGKVAGDLATAFTDSKAPDKSILLVGGLIAVALVAVIAFAKKG
jgi:hypothetical protein